MKKSIVRFGELRDQPDELKQFGARAEHLRLKTDALQKQVDLSIYR